MAILCLWRSRKEYGSHPEIIMSRYQQYLNDKRKFNTEIDLVNVLLAINDLKESVEQLKFEKLIKQESISLENLHIKVIRPPEDKSKNLDDEGELNSSYQEFSKGRTSNSILSKAANKPKVVNFAKPRNKRQSDSKLHIKSINNILTREMDQMMEDNKLIQEELQKDQNNEANEDRDHRK